MSATHHDVLIVGAGIVGATLAAALSRAGLRVALLESGAPRGFDPGAAHALRVSTINIASQRVLDGLGAWDEIAARRAEPVRRMLVWDAAGAGRIRFEAADLGEPWLAHVVENDLVQHALLQRLRDAPRVSLLFGAELRRIRLTPQRASCELADGRRLSAALVVGADGPASWVREAAGLGVSVADYGQRALVCNVRTEREHESTAWQRFMPSGPLAFLPLSGRRCAVVWSTDNDAARELLDLDDAAFCARLGAAIEHRLGALHAITPRAAFALRRQHAGRYVGPRVALIGDAAHTIHPLAGQGVNLGILDAATLAECLARGGSDPGALRPLRAYERWRRGENGLVMGVMDGFHHLFGTRAYWVRWLRNAGLTLTDAATPVKHALARHAMGLAGDLPALARGS